MLSFPVSFDEPSNIWLVASTINFPEEVSNDLIIPFAFVVLLLIESPTLMTPPSIPLTLNFDVVWSHPWLSTTNPNVSVEEPKFKRSPAENKSATPSLNLISYEAKLDSLITEPEESVLIPAEEVFEMVYDTVATLATPGAVLTPTTSNNWYP